MFKIQRPHELAEALRTQANVVLTRKGDWKVRGAFLGGLQSLLGMGANNKLSHARAILRAFDELEVVPVRFSGDVGAPAEQVIDFTGYLEVASALEELLSGDASPQARQLLARLQDRVVGLKFRLESANGGLDISVAHQEASFARLTERAAEWKAQQTAFYGVGLDENDQRRLAEAAKYDAFVNLLDNSAELRETFFQWTIRDRVDAPLFIQFPALRERLEKAFLTSRIGRFGGNLARIQKVASESNGASRKIVTLPFEGKEINILDEQRAVTFRGNYRLTIKQVFAVFAAKLERVGDLEFFSNGVGNWNAHLLGWWDADEKEYHQVDVTKAAWWKELPILERLTKEEAQARYGDHLDGQQWNVGVNATRTTRTLNPDASHAFIEMVVPITGGDYAVFALGKFATTYAGSLFDSMKLFTATLHATVAYPDENIFYTHREHVRRNFAVTAAEGMRYMESIRQDIIKARAGTFTYQIESENCAKWIQDKLEEHFGADRVPNLFRIDMLDTEPPGAAASLFVLLRKLPRALQSPALSVLHYFVGAWRGVWVEENGRREWRSITTTQFWQDKVCYIPAVLHQQVNPVAVSVRYAAPQQADFPGADSHALLIHA